MHPGQQMLKNDWLEADSKICYGNTAEAWEAKRTEVYYDIVETYCRIIII